MTTRTAVVCSRCLDANAKVIGMMDPNHGGALCAACWRDVQRLKKEPDPIWGWMEDEMPKKLYPVKCGECWRNAATTSVKGMDLKCEGCVRYDNMVSTMIATRCKRVQLYFSITNMYVICGSGASWKRQRT